MRPGTGHSAADRSAANQPAADQSAANQPTAEVWSKEVAINRSSTRFLASRTTHVAALRANTAGSPGLGLYGTRGEREERGRATQGGRCRATTPLHSTPVYRRPPPPLPPLPRRYHHHQDPISCGHGVVCFPHDGHLLRHPRSDDVNNENNDDSSRPPEPRSATRLLAVAVATITAVADNQSSSRPRSSLPPPSP